MDKLRFRPFVQKLMDPLEDDQQHKRDQKKCHDSTDFRIAGKALDDHLQDEGVIHGHTAP